MAWQYLFPQRAWTRLIAWVADRPAGPFTRLAMRVFVWWKRVDMSEAAEPELAAYDTFNAFFTRALRSDARPLAPADFLCPVDGCISECGSIAGDRLLQAKGQTYSLEALLGGDAALAQRFAGGLFATLYLSPRDYHRIHMPCAARPRRVTHVPGALFTVGLASAAGIPGLFARNERVICAFDAEFGDLALVLVGATGVRSVELTWHGRVASSRAPRSWDCDDAAPLARGAELGRFRLGSTVIVLLPPGVARLESDWRSGRSVRMGEAMGALASAGGGTSEGGVDRNA